MYKKIDDKPGYYLGLVLFTFAIPVIGAIGYWMAHQNTLLPSDERTSLVLRAPAPAAAPAAEAPAAEAPAAEAAH